MKGTAAATSISPRRNALDDVKLRSESREGSKIPVQARELMRQGKKRGATAIVSTRYQYDRQLDQKRFAFERPDAAREWPNDGSFAEH